jgi:hypothetical protein
MNSNVQYDGIPDLDKRLALIVAKLERLRASDPDLKVFGAKAHRYAFRSVLLPAELAEVERRLGQPLPAEYRKFVCEVGNGGAGPFYGLLAFDDNEDQSVNLDEDFPFTHERPFRCDSKRVELFSRQMDAARDEATKLALWNELDHFDVEDYARATRGLTFLCHEGCGMFDVLILRGECAGQVWWFDFCNRVGVLPLAFPNGEPLSFFDWYETWLDRKLDDHGNPLMSYAEFAVCN